MPKVYSSPKIKIPILEEIERYISKINNLIDEDIIDILAEVTDVIDLEEFFTNKLDELAKLESQ
jgi:hypothetical protein